MPRDAFALALVFGDEWAAVAAAESPRSFSRAGCDFTINPAVASCTIDAFTLASKNGWCAEVIAIVEVCSQVAGSLLTKFSIVSSVAIRTLAFRTDDVGTAAGITEGLISVSCARRNLAIGATKAIKTGA